jgi:CPA2 family monovalent cation:H+ antiporter-2
MRDAFAVLFFVSVGMLLEPSYVLKSPVIVLTTLAVVLVAKPVVAAVLVLVRGYPVRVALSVAVALGQIGEFSFILGSLGTDLKILPLEATNALVVTAIVSISVNPLIWRAVGPMEEWAARRPRIWRFLTGRVRPDGNATPSAREESDPRARAVVVGYGPIGQTICRVLQDNGVEPTVIEMNLQTFESLRADGRAAVYGDAVYLETLKAAGVDKTKTLVLSASSIASAEEVVRLARELNPDLRVIARSAYLRESAALRDAGADEVYSGEGELALAMTESVLRGLGATPDQIDRERERVRVDLIGSAPAGSPQGRSVNAPDSTHFGENAK